MIRLRAADVRCLCFFTLLCAVFSWLSPYFFSFSNAENVLSGSAVVGILALGSTFVIASGGIDLSIASVMALSGTAIAALLQLYPEMPAWLPLVLCCAAGALCGVVTGGLLVVSRAPSFIVTLGMMSVARALAYIIADGTPIYGLPEHVVEWGQGSLMLLPGPIAILAVVIVLSFFLLHFTRFGTHTLVLGDNSVAAEAMGVRSNSHRVKMFGLSGALAGISGFVFMSRTNAGDPTAGQNYELVAITAVILGGAKLFGGEASIIGTALGILCLGVLQNGLNLLAVSSYYQVLFVGLVLLGAAMFDRLGKKI